MFNPQGHGAEGVMMSQSRQHNINLQYCVSSVGFLRVQKFQVCCAILDFNISMLFSRMFMFA
jgi:hypothetical protein